MRPLPQNPESPSADLKTSADLESSADLKSSPTLKSTPRTLALITVTIGVIMDLLDTSIVNVALPTLRQDLGATNSILQWFVAAYALTFAAFLMLGGRLGDLIGYRTAFLIGAAGFGVASLGAGLAPEPVFLVVARLVQGAFAALMVPQTASLVQRMYAPVERSKIMGLLGGMAGLAAAAGPLIGGLLLRIDLGGAQWRLIFLINVPLAIATLVIGARILPRYVREHSRGVDVFGTILAATGLGAATFALTDGTSNGWSPMTVSIACTGAILCATFCFWEVRQNRRQAASLVVTRLFRKRSFTLGLVLTVITEAAFAGVMLTLTLALQNGLGYSPIVAGLSTLPLIAGMVLGAAVLGEILIPRVGRYTVTIGATLLAAGVILTAVVLNGADQHGWAWPLVPALALCGTGLGLLMGPLFAITLQDVERHNAGSASGTVKSVEQLGALIGITAIGAGFFARLAQDAANIAFGATAITVTGLLLVMIALTFWLPRRIKSEEELGLDV